VDKKKVVFLGLIILIVLIDQFAKMQASVLDGTTLIFSFLKWTYVQNAGAAFGMFSGGKVVLGFISLIVVGVICYLVYVKKFSWWEIVSLSFIAGGAIGNAIDRFFRVGVVDFLDLGWWPVFNIADSFVVVGVLILIGLEVLKSFSGEVPKKAQTSVEYVILLAIVIVIAILVGNNLNSFSGLGVRTGERKALAYMSAQDVAVLNYVITNESATLQIQNRYRDRIRISEVLIAGTPCTTSEIPAIFDIGAKKIVTCSNINATGRYEYNITITWKDIKNDATYVLNDSKMLLVGKNYQTALSSSGGSGDEGGDETPSIPGGLTYDLFLVEEYSASSVLVNQSTNTTNLGASLTYIGTTAAGYDSTSGSFLGKVFHNTSDVYWNSTVDSATSDYQDTLTWLDATGLVGYWRFDGDLSDSSSGGNTGINSGSTDTVGMVGYGRKFDGADDRIVVSDVDELSFTDGSENDEPFSISVWLYRDEVTSTDVVLSKGSANNYEWTLSVNHVDSLSISLYSPSAAESISTTATGELPAGKWYHVVVTYTGSETAQGITLFVNGKNVTDTFGGAGTYTGMTNKDTDVWISGRVDGYYWDGMIDEVLLFNRVLSPTEAIGIFDGQKNYYGVEMFEEYGVFDGTNDRVQIGDEEVFEFDRTDPFSGCAWVEQDSIRTVHTIISKQGQYAPFAGWNFQLYDGNSDALSFTLTNNNNGNLIHVRSASGSIPAGELKHVCFSYDGSSSASGVDLFIDGEGITEIIVSDTLTDTSYHATAAAAIGARHNSVWPFQGKIDEVLMWNDAISASDVTEVYSLAKNLDSYSHENLISHWSMDTNLKDRVGGYNGSASSGAYTTDGLISYWPLDGSFDDLMGI